MVQDPPEGMPDLSGVERSDPDDEILVLVVEDDLGYAVLVEELLADSGESIKAVVARSVDEARALVSSAVTCVLLDLGLPDAEGLDALEGVLAAAPDVAVVVLTGRAESDLALGAVARRGTGLSDQGPGRCRQSHPVHSIRSGRKRAIESSAAGRH